jgi:hypothetical protein
MEKICVMPIIYKLGLCMKRYFWLCLVLTGCSTIKDYIPSFWDGNQAQRITDIRMEVAYIDCRQQHHAQAQRILRNVEWFELYSQGRDHRDMLKLIKPIKETVQEFYDRTKEKDASEMYCKLKQELLQTQTERAARAVLGRF